MRGLLRRIVKKLRRAVAGPRLDLPQVFQRFKEVLESNNHALEIVTDMGEQLGGEYIFDIVYVKDSYQRLYESMESSISRFEELAGREYEIRPTLYRIDALVKRALDDSAQSGVGPAVFLEDINWSMYDEVGGKVRNLARMRNELGLSVPAGFALTSHAFDIFIGHNHVGDRLHALDHDSIGDSDVAAIREAIISGEMPRELRESLNRCVSRLAGYGSGFLAVRSSAGEEDGELSFAGQFETMLNVPIESASVGEAYRRILASMYTRSAFAYARSFGMSIEKMKMSVACIRMVDAHSAGVLYTADPADGSDRIIINSVWGLGNLVVDGRVDADEFTLQRRPELRIVKRRTGSKPLMAVLRREGGVDDIETPDILRRSLSLTEEQVLELARTAMLIEERFRGPQDIEWAIDKEGRVYMLQARPLRISSSRTTAVRKHPVSATPIIRDFGLVVQKGAAAGKVFALGNMEELDSIPRGAILVAKNDSPQFVRAMPHVAAIITDTGAVASHMASICREFRIPTVVNTRDASRRLRHGQVVTLQATEDDAYAVYDGILTELIDDLDKSSPGVLENLHEFRRKKYIMRYIAPLNLINPLTHDFTPEGCRTMHDILRFIHEKSVQALIESSTHAAKSSKPVRLELPVPADISIVDIGGGLRHPHDGPVTLENLDSEPLKAVAEGMCHPGAWHSGAVALQATDFFSSMLRMEDITVDGSRYASNNIAVISREYLNLAIRFGYHFNMIDCYCGEKAANNHIYFRFVGGATDITKRSRRIRLVGEILRESGFILTARGDMIIARLSHVGREEILVALQTLGRLLAFARQLDAVLTNDADVMKYRDNFFNNNFELM